MSSNRRTVKASMLVAGMMMLASLAATAGTRLTADHPTPIQVGDQVFAGGKVELEKSGDNLLITMRINGKTVAHFLDVSARALPDSGRIDLVFHKQSGGPDRLVGIQEFAARPETLNYHELQVASVNRNLALVSSAALR